MNISSVIVHARPASISRLREQLGGLAGVELHAVSAEGKMIITIESTSDRDTADTFEAIGKLDGVMSVSLVYHQTESDPEREVSVQADVTVGP